MLSASIHGERERAKRRERKREGKETELAMCVTKTCKKLGKGVTSIKNNVFCLDSYLEVE